MACMTRSSSNNLHAFNPEIDKTLHSSANINSESNIVVNTSDELDPMENNNRTLKEFATSDILIHLLPKFHGLVGEDPYKHLKEFHVVCSTMRSHGILEDYIKMKAFSFSLDGTAKNWLYFQPVLFNT
ncbi:hypothetical protein CR513_23393, partial [Mucuna pruriens]